jgi:DNA-binding NarL/FixJ family response regulator
VRSVLVCVRTQLAAQAVQECATRLGLGGAIDTVVSGPEALALLDEAPADVILVDTAVSRPDTVGFTRRLRERAPEATIVFFGPEEVTIARAAVAAGARGLIRGGPREDLVTSVAKAIMLLLRPIRPAVPVQRQEPERPDGEPATTGPDVIASAPPGGTGAGGGAAGGAAIGSAAVPGVGAGPSGGGGPAAAAGPDLTGTTAGPAGATTAGPNARPTTTGPNAAPTHAGPTTPGSNAGPSTAGPTNVGPTNAGFGGAPAGNVGTELGVGAVGHAGFDTTGTRRHALTEREMQVLRGMAEGKSNAEIGRELYVSEDTVKTHARRLFRKLDARDRAHAVAAAFRAGLVR